MSLPHHYDGTNILLRGLPPEEFAALAPYLERERLALGQSIFEPDRPIEHVWFPESIVASVISGADGDAIEVGLIGREGMTGLMVVGVALVLVRFILEQDQIILLVGLAAIAAGFLYAGRTRALRGNRITAFFLAALGCQFLALGLAATATGPVHPDTAAAMLLPSAAAGGIVVLLPRKRARADRS